MHFDSR